MCVLGLRARRYLGASLDTYVHSTKQLNETRKKSPRCLVCMTFLFFDFGKLRVFGFRVLNVIGLEGDDVTDIVQILYSAMQACGKEFKDENLAVESFL